jgi:hypothetical protein
MVRHIHLFQLFALTIIFQCIFNAMSTDTETGQQKEAAAGSSPSDDKLMPIDNVVKMEAATAAGSSSTSTIPIPIAIRWRKLPNFGYLNSREISGSIGNGRFEIQVFPTNSHKIRRTTQPLIRDITGHYDVAILTGLSTSWVDILTNRETAASTHGYDGLAVEIRMQFLAEEKAVPRDTLEWNQAQVRCVIGRFRKK